jgi:hypothetical protein
MSGAARPAEQLTTLGIISEPSSGWNAFQMLSQGDKVSMWRLFQNSGQANYA